MLDGIKLLVINLRFVNNLRSFPKTHAKSNLRYIIMWRNTQDYNYTTIHNSSHTNLSDIIMQHTSKEAEVVTPTSIP